MITTHYLLLCALFDARPSGHAIKKWWNKRTK